MSGVRSDRGEGLEGGDEVTPLWLTHTKWLPCRGTEPHFDSDTFFLCLPSKCSPVPTSDPKLIPPGSPASGTRAWPHWEKRAGLHCRSSYWGPSSLGKQMLYLSIKRQVEFTKPCCLHGEEK